MGGLCGILASTCLDGEAFLYKYFILFVALLSVVLWSDLVPDESEFSGSSG